MEALVLSQDFCYDQDCKALLINDILVLVEGTRADLDGADVLRVSLGLLVSLLRAIMGVLADAADSVHPFVLVVVCRQLLCNQSFSPIVCFRDIAV